VRALLLYLAQREGFKNFALNFRVFRNTAKRFIAGETLDDAIRVVRQANRQGLNGTLDFLGENTLTRDDAGNACQELIDVLSRIAVEKLECTISVKLTQLGLDLNPDFARGNLTKLAKHAHDKGNFVRVDMEDSRYTQRALDVITRVHEEVNNIGAVIQAYLRRSERDVADMMAKGIRIRLVKGAYLEPESMAFRKKSDTDAHYLKLMKLLLAAKTYNAIATHDESMILAAKEFAASRGILKDHFEFQMLYGIRRDLQLRLAQEGYKVRIYIPYGRQWYSYLMRRLAERPANVAFIIRNLFKD
jgi:proline dehydrogenase